MGSGGGSTTINSEDREYNARMATIAEAQQQMAEEYYQYYQQYYQPYEKEQIAANRQLIPQQVKLQEGALETATTALDPASAMREAEADVAQSFAGAQGSIERNLSRRGVSMDSGQAVGMQKDIALERAKAIGGARTQARQNVSNRAMGILGGR